MHTKTRSCWLHGRLCSDADGHGLSDGRELQSNTFEGRLRWPHDRSRAKDGGAATAAFLAAGAAADATEACAAAACAAAAFAAIGGPHVDPVGEHEPELEGESVSEGEAVPDEGCRPSMTCGKRAASNGAGALPASRGGVV